jgi:hypothetical protein
MNQKTALITGVPKQNRTYGSKLLFATGSDKSRKSEFRFAYTIAYFDRFSSINL